MSHVHAQTVPRAALFGAAALMLATIALAAGSRRAHLAEPPPHVSPALESATLTFEDKPDGTLAVLDASTRREVTRVAPQTNGFIRGVLRGMFRQRKLESIDRSAEFLLAREASGRLTLTDPASGRKVDLDSFGPTNSEAFAAILVAARAK